MSSQNECVPRGTARQVVHRRPLCHGTDKFVKLAADDRLFDLLAWYQAEHVAKEAEWNEPPHGGRAGTAAMGATVDHRKLCLCRA
ncbi:MAG: hypothetical protein MK161_02915 [Pirellulales bacterium]|nr:hypothetical protein [Pirellulales bacterium]